MKQNKKIIIIALSTLAIGLLLGWLIFGGSSVNEMDKEDQHTTEVAGQTIWTCSMHPQIRQGEPGDCPICGMNLIPLDSEQDEQLDPMAISMSATAMQLANIRTTTVGTMDPIKEVRLTGKVQKDERLVFSQSSHIPGRLEKLMVNFTGEYVRRGQAIAYLYSPELVTAQEELLEAQKIKETQPQLFNAAKEKLINWNISHGQIEQILKKGAPKQQFAIQADVSGYVTEKMVNLGDYINRGQPLYEIANLSKVWVLFDVYESDMPWIKKGDNVNFTVSSFPGETFEGRISFIDPVIDPKTRVAKARVEFSNKALRLKPEMFVRGTVMATLPAKSNNMVIPKTAVMWTGKRSVVYVKNTSNNGVSFMMRKVVLGSDLGESFVIDSGLQEGEEIAVNGTFSIDAAAQLAGKPSMMNPDGGVAMTGHDHGGTEKPASSGELKKAEVKPVSISRKAKAQLSPLYTKYFELKDALTKDDFQSALARAKELKSVFQKIDMKAFQGDAHEKWMEYHGKMERVLEHIHHHKDIESLRKNFIALSDWMIEVTGTFHPISEKLYLQHCPMADNDRGADWLSQEESIVNPYFGNSMLTCGEVKRIIN
jgi:Cu(I)/Ag(I) efflux system membrane fusion protein